MKTAVNYFYGLLLTKQYKYLKKKKHLKCDTAGSLKRGPGVYLHFKCVPVAAYRASLINSGYGS